MAQYFDHKKTDELNLTAVKANPKRKKIVVGGGIAGLSAAFSLSLRGHDVIVLDNRNEYRRDQRIFCPTLNKQYARPCGRVSAGS